MIRTITSFWQDWKHTAIGKAVEDYFWYLVAAISYVAVDASLVFLTDNQSGLTQALGPYGAILVAGAGKSLSFLRDKLQDPRVPNTPQTSR